jgi:hypothetical protein
MCRQRVMQRPDPRRLVTALLRQHWLLAGACSGAVFVAVFSHWSPLPAEAYQYRDDALITLSHARNLVDFGSIGVDAAGARVEGFSTPLQFWVFALAYAVTHCAPTWFLDLQALCCTFLLGFAVVQLFRPSYRFGLLLSAAVAFGLSSALRFFGWHHSGMENAYTHATFVATLACIVVSVQRGEVRAYMVLCALLASLARLESILHIAPLLVIWALCYAHAQRSWRGALGGAAVLLGWSGYQLFRYAYFGSFQPNTAVAEHIDVLARLQRLWSGNEATRAESVSLMRQIASEHRAYLALAALPLLPFARPRPAQAALLLMLSALLATGLLHPLLFGAARLDPVRTTSHVALVAPLLLASVCCCLPGAAARGCGVLACLCVCWLYLRLEGRSDREFCCPVPRADVIGDLCEGHARAEALPRPSLASPDLGKQSYKKRFLMFDLGWLGSPPLAALHAEPRASAEYLLELAAPDYIELHGVWSCGYLYVQRDRRFAARYAPVPQAQRLQLLSGCAEARAGIWFRKDVARASLSPERRLIDDLLRRYERQRIARELEVCRKLPGRSSCVYVTRTVYRFVPELVARGELDAVIALFRSSPSAKYDMAVLGSREHGAWYRDVLEFARGR